MRELLLAYEPHIRLAAFAGILAIMAAWEALTPRRHQLIGRGVRWPNNIAIVAVDTVFVRFALPTTAVGAALMAEARGWGLFNALVFPAWAAIPLA